MISKHTWQMNTLVRAFWPACRVLVVGCSSQPWLVPKKDESAFLGTWTKMLHLPLPDYAAGRVSSTD